MHQRDLDYASVYPTASWAAAGDSLLVFMAIKALAAQKYNRFCREGAFACPYAFVQVCECVGVSLDP